VDDGVGVGVAVGVGVGIGVGVGVGIFKTTICSFSDPELLAQEDVNR